MSLINHNKISGPANVLTSISNTDISNSAINDTIYTGQYREDAFRTPYRITTLVNEAYLDIEFYKDFQPAIFKNQIRVLMKDLTTAEYLFVVKSLKFFKDIGVKVNG